MALPYMNPAHVLIDYSEVMALMQSSHDLDMGTRSELQMLLATMIAQYFCRYSNVINERHEAQVSHMLAAADAFELKREDWENSDIAMAVTLMIVKITQTFLPGFSAHRDEDCNMILDVTMRTPTVAHLVIDPIAFERFAKPLP